MSLSLSPVDQAAAAALSPAFAVETDERLRFVRTFYEAKGYRVHSGLQFGCEFVLYADDPSRVHSDFCVHVVKEDGILDWRLIQILVRSMPSLHKTLILAYIRKTVDNTSSEASWTIDELAIGTEHAPFRHKKQAFIQEPGVQQKKRKLDDDLEPEPTEEQATSSSDPTATEIGR